MPLHRRSSDEPRARREVSHWWTTAGPRSPRAPLASGRDADVCIVGGGFTGLWTAYHLIRARPGLRIVVLEARHVGYGASGRNGGALTADIAGTRSRLLSRHGRDAVVALQREMEGAVRSVLEVCAAEGIRCDQHRGGSLRVARNRAQERRLREAVAEDRALGRDEDDVRILGPGELADRVRVSGARAARLDRRGARIQPARLVLGLAAAVERHGVTIHEDTPVRRIVGARGRGVAPGTAAVGEGELGSGRNARAVTDRGNVRAPCVLRCTDGFTSDLPGERRTWLPLSASMVVTEPLDPRTWGRIGWDGAETLSDAAHACGYAQRTVDGRIALGGRGAPYRFGSRRRDRGPTPDRTVRRLTDLVHAWFPGAADVPIADAWSGVLAVPRDWTPTVALDRAAGLGWAGGYVGTGIAASELAGRTLRDLVLADDTPLTRLPWVRDRSRRWECEPLRWLAVHGVEALYRTADRREDARDRDAGSGGLAGDHGGRDAHDGRRASGSGTADGTVAGTPPSPGRDRDDRLARIADRVAGR